MSHYGPFNTTPQLIERTTHMVDLMLLNNPQVLAYQLWGAGTVNDAYGAPTNSKVTGSGGAAFLTVNRGETFRSNLLQRRRAGLVEESRRGQTRIQFDADDFAPIPQDCEMLFVRVQEKPVTTGVFNTVQGVVNNGNPVLGPILILPTVEFFGLQTPVLPIQGSAPANTGCVMGSPPVIHEDGQTPDPMHIVLPRRTISLTIQATGSANLLVSFGLAQPMTRVTALAEAEISYEASIKDLVLASADNSGGGAVNAPFSIYAVVALGV